TVDPLDAGAIRAGLHAAVPVQFESVCRDSRGCEPPVTVFRDRGMRVVAAAPPAAQAVRFGTDQPVFGHFFVSLRKKAGYDLFVDLRVTGILPAFERGVVVHLNNVRVAIIIFYVHAVQATPDRVRRIDAQPDDMRGHGLFRNALDPAIDEVPVDRGLDL